MTDATDPAVGAILLADMLLTQYRAVVVRLEPQVMTGNTDGMALEIPEANRVFAGAWEQLEHARAELASRGLDTSAFDALRRQQGAATRFGVLDSTSASG